MNSTVSARTSNRIAAGVTAAYLHDLSRHQRRRRATAATHRSAASRAAVADRGSPPPGGGYRSAP